MVVGGTAVGFYGHYRLSTVSDGIELGKHDLDFWYEPVISNYYKLLDALESLGVTVDAHRQGIAVPRESFFRYDFGIFKTDFLPEVPGLKSFAEAYLKVEDVIIENVTIPIISLVDLYVTKESVGRKKDLEDIAALKSLNAKK